MKFKCNIHGSSLHCHVCQHVAQACKTTDLPVPELGETAIPHVVCRNCLSPKVRKLLQGFSIDSARDSPNHQQGAGERQAVIERNIEHFFECYEQLKTEIGFSP